ncbi:MAG: TolC family protein [Hydrogenovibrio crunogenus]|uniref:RND outer membrane protein n=1 Tax=Hydrogenovibrio crunogenus (strain DSM 25203 / XCL-2) TaxID=317025 RepID=Q31EH2_HYDCU|nr:TolC family protein [Hydrogenovibrio crunogenus]
MKFKIYLYLAIGWGGYLFSTSAVYAVEDSLSWKAWLFKQVENHPEIISAKENMNSTFSLADGQSKPIYNPELETELEKEGSFNNYNIGVTQTIDWWGKQENRNSSTDSIRAIARYTYEEIYLEKLKNALSSIVSWHAAKARFELAQNQQSQFDALIQLVKKRQRSGDLGQIDVEMTLLSLSQKLNETATLLAEYKSSEANLRVLLPSWDEKELLFPRTFFDVELEQLDQESLSTHPSVLKAMSTWRIRKFEAEMAALNTKSDPTFGVSIGESTNESKIGLSLSIPLNIRNNYKAESLAAKQKVLSAKSTYDAVKSKLFYQIVSAGSVVQHYKVQVAKWDSLMTESKEQSQELLERQWRAGDISTNVYLMALQSRMDGLIAGIDLKEQYQLYVLDWLYKTGRIKSYLANIS